MPPVGDNKVRGRAQVLVKVDLFALLRGYPIGDEECEIAGYGPTTIQAIQDLIATGNPWLTAIATNGKKVVGVANLTRSPDVYQRAALQLALTRMRRRRLPRHRQPPNRPPRRLGRHPPHRPRSPRTHVHPRPQQEDPPRLGPHRRHRQTTLRPTRRPPTPHATPTKTTAKPTRHQGPRRERALAAECPSGLDDA